uniref:Uncharacterized protein n=1 Tax=Avena sativa TaxID=4498 RepID=A0ACD5WE60_AVESA
MAETNSYEEQRRRQIEENKRKLDELRLHKLSAAVRQAAAKPTPAKLLVPRNPRLDAPIRRSGRIASLPEQPDYRPAKAQRNERTELPSTVPVYATDEERAYAITKAEELKDQLGSDYPTFIKPMSQSYATKNNNLFIPMHFRQYLLVHDDMMVLVDEMNNEFDVLYSCKTNGRKQIPSLRRWRRFAAEHDLADGDCLVFQLIERTKFKVYVVRVSSYNKNDH